MWPDADGSGGISIHAPRMGSDRLAQIRAGAPVGISIHAPRMGSDGPLTDTYSGVSSFQSTLPGWGATGGLLVAAEEQHHFNPRSPDGERRVEQSLLVPMPGISIHAPRMGSDVRVIARMPFGDPISIHAPRMGSDHPDVDYLIVANQFQSTLPGWGATIAGACDGDRQRFQSTLPGWGATPSWTWA